jgi:GINS complex subunit 2
LWLGLQLKANQKCKLIPPFWLDEEVLQDFQDKEKKNPTELINLQHEEFFEISYIYFSQAPDDVPKLPQMRALVEGL